MIEILLLPFEFYFMQNAFLIGLIIAVPTALLSCFLVVKGWSLMGDAISHAVLPGIVLSYIFSIPLMIGAFVAGIFCAMATNYLSENCRVKQDTVMGVVFSGMFAAGLVLYTSIETDVHLDHILFGNMLGVSIEDIIITIFIAICVSSFLAMKWSDLVLQSFDPLQARASGLNVRVLNFFAFGIYIFDSCCHFKGHRPYISDCLTNCARFNRFFDNKSISVNDASCSNCNNISHVIRYLS
jgi:manganese/iron transport system permease protein